MKQSLQLRMGQQLSMTPQLQQAIKLLQLSTLDLQQEIQQALDSNIMLEVIEDNLGANEQPITEDKVDNQTDEINSEGSEELMPNELAVDSSWDDVFEPQQTGIKVTNAVTENADFAAQRSEPDSLYKHLIWQVEMAPLSARDREIALAIIDSVGTSGYLMVAINEIFDSLGDTLEELTLDEVKAVLHRVQRFDPIGVAAENLKDCLSIQLAELDDDTPFKVSALRLVNEFLDDLASQNKAKLLRRLALSEIELAEVTALVRSLEPRPGESIATVVSDCVVPDLFVQKTASGEWRVSLNPDISPKLQVNTVYSKMIQRGKKDDDNVRLREHLQEARWFIKSLHSRNDTLLRVGCSIIERQLDFLEQGDMAMKPLVLKEIAEDLGLHESTISRVTTQKYMHLPTGIVELKYFFSSHVSTASGGECSATAIRAFIQELIEHENQVKPLSDKKIADFLAEKGINVARRTIAKYREALAIPSSSQRKRLF